MDSQLEKVYAEKFKKSIVAIHTLQKEIEELKKKNGNEPIAIVGMACRFPGSSNTPEEYWDLLKNGKNATTEIPSIRWDKDTFFHPVPGTPGKTHVKHGGFIDNIEMFDNLFFGISNREALLMDPLHRLLLEVTFEGLEDAGLDLEKLNGSETSVFMGFGDNTEYASKHILSGSLHNIDPYSLTGYMTTAASGRISYLLGLEGGNVSLSTGCSSSLVAIHLACQTLRTREANMAIAGGANLIISPSSYVALSNMEAISPDGKCKSFDASADGYGRSDGIGVIVLKRLSDALKDNDSVWAVIKGTAINQDGKSNGFTAPSVRAQEKVIASALKNANVSPDEVDFIEAHGTGTRIGDPIEMEAIKNAYCAKRTTQRPLYVGTVKSNFGHSEGASGIAGVIKVVLALNNKQIPANLNFTKPNPLISWDDMNVKIPVELTDWRKNEGLRTGAISAFGISGTNAHVIIQERPLIEDKPLAANPLKDVNILTISAKNTKALRNYAEKYIQFLRNNGQSHQYSLQEICNNAALRRTHYAKRIAISASSPADLIQRLETIITEGFAKESLELTGKKVVFVFPGQGSQWIGMGRDLMDKNPVFRKTIASCEEAFQKYVPWKLSDVIDGREPRYSLEEINVIQPVLFAVEVALAEMWKSMGVTPDAVIGHSMGEVAAAYVAGIIGIDDAAKIICTRSLLLGKIKGQGRMLAADLAFDEALELVKDQKNVSVAVSNGPQSTVLSGEPSTLEKICQNLEAANRFARFVKVDVASHSPQTDVLLPEFIKLAGSIECRNSSVKFFSTVKAASVPGNELNSSYWSQNIRESVRFSQTVSLLLNQQYAYFIEVSPHPVLQAPIEQIADAEKAACAVITSLKRDEQEYITFLDNFSNLYVAGYDVNWKKIYADIGNRVKLPTYPWQRTRFWLDTPLFETGACKGILTDVSELSNELIEKNSVALLDQVKLAGSEQGLSLLKLYIRNQLRFITGYDEEMLNDTIQFIHLGIDSMMMMRLKRILEKDLHLEVSIRNLMTYPSIVKLSSYLLEMILNTSSVHVQESKDTNSWFIIPKPNKDAEIRLFCFHDAGGSSSLFNNWQNHLPGYVELVLLELPGRGLRIEEKCIRQMDALIPLMQVAIKPFLDKPFVFFGHSMGGELCFELARELDKAYHQKPLYLFISSAQCFNGSNREVTEHKLSEEELAKLFPALKKENFHDDEFYQIILKTLRADLELLSTYKYKPGMILDIPIVAFWAEDDNIVSRQDVERWKKETTSSFKLITRKGGHRYIDHDYFGIIEIIMAESDVSSVKQEKSFDP